MKTGYGLSNYWSVEDGFVLSRARWRSRQAADRMAYMPDYGVGYFFSINSGKLNEHSESCQHHPRLYHPQLAIARPSPQ